VTKRYWKFREEVSSLLVELKTEISIYINSINMLVIGVIEQKDMSDLLASPGRSFGKKISLVESCRSVLEVVIHRTSRLSIT
jgi:hypothetical protein